MKHDFFTEQPVKAARAYHLHSVLHDWPDDACKKILKQLVSVMKPGYSRLLLNEIVIPNKGAERRNTALDIWMAVLNSAKERTEKEWHTLLGSPELGLKITGIWLIEGTESLIECELKD